MGGTVSSGRRHKVLILGQHGAGKTTVLNKLQAGSASSSSSSGYASGFIGTISFLPTTSNISSTETIRYRNYNFEFCELNQDNIRLYGRCYDGNADAIVYMIDSSDKSRLKSSKKEFREILRDDNFSNAILAILVNKQDKDDCLTEGEVYDAFKMHKYHHRKFKIFEVSATKGFGLIDVLDWLHEKL